VPTQPTSFPSAPSQKEINPQVAGANDWNWKMIEADNGAISAISLNTIRHSFGGSSVDVGVWLEVDNGACTRMTTFLFDCRGHYLDLFGSRPDVTPANPSGMFLAPPRPVVGQMAAIACEKGHAPSR
jgi:hypothetical protein